MIFLKFFLYIILGTAFFDTFSSLWSGGVLVSPWTPRPQQSTDRERELEELLLMFLTHTSHTDLSSPVSHCLLCVKVGLQPTWTRTS